jgi:hypothetical protein
MQGIFALLSCSIFLGFTDSKNIGLLLASIAYGGSAFASFQLMAWWPLGVGYFAVFTLNALGFNPARK